jgi:hypothetical protein
MPSIGWTPRIVPYGADQTVYLVIDRFGVLGSVYREVERTELETIISEFLTGEFNDPVRVLAFNTLEHWSDDVSQEVAAEIQTRCDIEGIAIPEHMRDFVASFTGPTWQVALAGLIDAVLPAHALRAPGD